MQNRDIAWAAGFYEGEGTCVFIKSGRSVRVEFKIPQVERETLDWCVDIFGVGSVHGPYRNGKNTIYSYYLQRYEDVRMVMNRMWPYLSERRQEQAAKAFDRYMDYKQIKEDEQKTCRKNVHPRIKPGRCLPCRNEYARAYRKEKYEIQD